MKIHGSRPIDVTRRTFLGVAGTIIAAGTSTAQQVVRTKGPLVWLNMDQKELDDAYTQSVYALNIQQVVSRYATNSEATRRRLGSPRRFSYGPTSVEELDVYMTNLPNAPIHVFIHGGTWRSGQARNYAFLAETFVRAGAHFVIVDFTNVIDTGGDLMPLADQVRRAVAWVYRNASSFGGDPSRLFVSGHSSGGHLAGVILVTDWQERFNLPADTVKGGLCCSGMFDLEPVGLSVRRSYVNFTDKIKEVLSPQRHLANLACPIVIAYGTLETPEFQRQSRDFATAVEAEGKPVRSIVGQSYNHFEILETLGNPYGLLGRAALEQMELA